MSAFVITALLIPLSKKEYGITHGDRKLREMQPIN